MVEPEDGAIEAYWKFFETFNSRDSRVFGSALNFPHVRVSARGPAAILPDADAHAASMNYGRILASGWHHSVGAEPEVEQVSPHKVHISGGWTRFNETGQAILKNRVTYIITLVDGHWGIQSRFGIDPGDDVAADDTSAAHTVKTAFELMGTDNPRAAHFFHYPHIVVNPGDIESIDTPDDLAAGLPGSAMMVTNVETIQAGPTGVNVLLDATFGERIVEALVLVTLVDGRWGIKSRSLIMS
ncbi:MAG: hypothetical protein O2780_05670 [Proteobacteria bacterium]|jgi:hypothetical protein|nr:hypothetical protein [Pseudomonadota bacterium]MDA1300112.1 hypothetical protein [Pseudomonadota bacterium]